MCVCVCFLTGGCSWPSTSFAHTVAALRIRLLAINNPTFTAVAVERILQCNAHVILYQLREGGQEHNRTQHKPFFFQGNRCFVFGNCNEYLKVGIVQDSPVRDLSRGIRCARSNTKWANRTLYRLRRSRVQLQHPIPTPNYSNL